MRLFSIAAIVATCAFAKTTNTTRFEALDCDKPAELNNPECQKLCNAGDEIDCWDKDPLYEDESKAQWEYCLWNYKEFDCNKWKQNGEKMFEQNDDGDSWMDTIGFLFQDDSAFSISASAVVFAAVAISI